MSTFFECGSNEQFKFALSIYQQTIQVKTDAKKSKSSDLVELDNWFQNDLPEKIQSRGAEAHITHEELTKTINWKLERGKFRPRLQELVTSNPSLTVVEQSKKSIKTLRETRDIEAGIKSLCTLRGVGPALASAVLAAAVPQQVPFMADECLLSIASIGRCEYTIKEYIKYVEEMTGCVKRLNSQSQGTKWTPHTVELAVWAHHVASHLKPELLDDMPKLMEEMPATQVSEKTKDKETPEMGVLELGRVDGFLELGRVDGFLELGRVDGFLPPVSLVVGSHFLGRGPLLQITDTKVSRKHAKINITNEGEATLTALHASPCFVREEGGEWTNLEQNESKNITQNMQIKFTPNVWHYEFSLVGDKCEEKADSEKATQSKPTDSSVDVDSEPIQPSKDAIEELDLNTEADAEPKGIRSLRKVLNRPSDLIKKTSDSLTEYEQSKPIATKSPKKRQLAEDVESKGIRNLGKVLTKPSDDLIKKTSDSLTESESSKLTTVEPEKSKPIATTSPKKRQLPDWLLKLTEENGVSPLRSNSMKRKLDPEDENIVVQKDTTPTKSPKRIKKSHPISTNTSLMPSTASTASTSTGHNPNSEAPNSCSAGDIQDATSVGDIQDATSVGDIQDATSAGDIQDATSVGDIQDATNNFPSKDFKVKSPAKKNKFPVLVTPEDFQDSEDDGEKENKVKQKKDIKKKAREASRASCPHAASCYRKNPIHFQEEAHPGDPDYKNPDEVESDDDRPECEFGTNCYRKNPDHKRNFKHSHKPQPTRRTKNKKKAQAVDDLDDSFIDDDSEESIDDTDDDEDYEPEINSSQD